MSRYSNDQVRVAVDTAIKAFHERMEAIDFEVDEENIAYSTAAQLALQRMLERVAQLAFDDADGEPMAELAISLDVIELVCQSACGTMIRTRVFMAISTLVRGSHLRIAQQRREACRTVAMDLARLLRDWAEPTNTR